MLFPEQGQLFHNNCYLNLLFFVIYVYSSFHFDAVASMPVSSTLRTQFSSRVSPFLYDSRNCISSKNKPIVETNSIACPCFIKYEISSQDTTIWDVFVISENAYNKWMAKNYSGDPRGIVEKYSTRKQKTNGKNSFLDSPDYNAFIEGKYVLVVRTNTDKRRCFDEPLLNGKRSFIVFESMPKPCPIQSHELKSKPKIVGGTIVNETNSPDKFEWMALIWVRNNFPVCGGVHIGDGYVLTAAHCLIQLAPTNFRVRLGVMTASSGRSLKISRVFTHPEFTELDTKEMVNDLSIIELSDGSFAKSKPSIRMNDDSSVPKVGEFVTTAGFGHISEGWTALPIPNRLLRVDVPVVAGGECSNAYKSLNENVHLCAGYMKRDGCDSCQSDSGGPLRYVSRRPDGLWTQSLVGLVSFGNGCARSLNPGVYTRMSAYAHWVNTTVQQATETRNQMRITFPIILGIIIGAIIFIIALIVVILILMKKRKVPASPRQMDVEQSDVPSTTGISL